MRILIAFLAAVALVSAPTAARAEPISLLVIAGINALAGSTVLVGSSTLIGTLTVTQAITAALTVGAAIAFSVLAPTGKIEPDKAKETWSSEASEEIRIVGRARVGGLKAFGNTTGYDRWRVIAQARGEILEIEEYWINGHEVVVEADGSVSSPPWAIPGSSWCWIWSKPGRDDETAWSQLIEAFPSLWTADHRLRGIAQILVKFISPGVTEAKFMKLYSGGTPEIEVVRRGEPIYDPRTGLTGWSDNGILCCLHLALTYPEFSLDDFDLADLALEADKADALVVTRGGGFERRSRVWGLWSSETKRGDTMKAMLDSAGAEIVWIGEKLSIRLIDDTRPAEVTIPARAIVDYALSSGPEAVERPNICVIKFYCAARHYEMSEIDMTGIEWARIDQEIDRWGPKQAALDLPFCPSASQAQRVARRLFARLRGDVVTIETDMTGLVAWGCNTIGVEIADLGETLVGEAAPPKIDDDKGTVSLSMTVLPPLAPWDPETMEAPAPDPIPDIPASEALATPSAPTRMIEIVYPDDSRAIRIAFAAPGGIFDGLVTEATWRTLDGTTPSAWMSMVEGSGVAESPIASTLVGVTGQARIRIFSGDDGSNWSDVLETEIVIGDGPLGAPSISLVAATGTLTVRAPADLDVAYLIVTGPGAAGTLPAGPGGSYSFDLGPDPTGTWSVTAYTSGGSTASATVSISN